MDIKKLPDELRRQLGELRRMIRKDAPAYFAAAAEKMKDANFSAQGFVVGGAASPRWPSRKVETARSTGKRILHATGTLQASVHYNARPGRVVAWIDTNEVPYAKVHNEGGRVIQHVRPHHRTHPKSGKRYQVRGFARKVIFPKRQYLGYSPDIDKIAGKDIDMAVAKIFKK